MTATSSAIYKQFNKQAIAYDLSGRQMQLWQFLYELLAGYGRHDVMIHTSLLLDGLEISRSQFLRIRQVLVEWGFLAIRQNSRQQTFYTLLLEGRQVALAAAAPQKDECSKDARPSAPEPAVQEERRQPSAAPSTPAPAETDCSAVPAQPSSPMASQPTQSPAASTFSISGEAFPGGDVILNNACSADLQQFYEPYDNAMLSGYLRQWVEMRRKNGWTLTSWGLWTLLEKLRALAEDSAERMASIVQQSLKRRWKGFYPLQAQRCPSGERLRKLEEQQAREKERNRRHLPKSLRKFEADDTDLSFLEE